MVFYVVSYFRLWNRTDSFSQITTAVDKSPEDILRERFTEMNINLEAFSSLRYIGIQTKQAPTDYSVIRKALLLELENTTVRSPRPPEVIFKAIDVIIRSDLYALYLFYFYLTKTTLSLRVCRV